MSIFGKLRKARKDYVCASEWAHDRTIRRGEIYARVKAAPDDPDHGNGKWQEITVHPECTEVNLGESG